MMSQLLNQQMLERDAVVSKEFFQSLSQGHNPAAYFRNGDSFSDKALIERLFEHVAQMPDVMQIIAYNRQRTVVWSNYTQLIGKQMKNNVELEESFGGKVVFHRLHSDPERKVEHGYLPQQDTDFLENYIQIFRRICNATVLKPLLPVTAKKGWRHLNILSRMWYCWICSLPIVMGWKS